MVEVLDEVEPALGHGGAGEHTDTTGDHARGHALGVRIDGVEDMTRTHDESFRSGTEAVS
ncbi:hypothetical protein GCM10010217_44010 [Streptomyces tubercidicus]